MFRWVDRIWYGSGRAYWLLMPLAAVFWLVTSLRRALYRHSLLPRSRAGVPLIIVGNITAGGTGKTPVTIWLASALRARGFAPGIVSRGYGGSGAASSVRVDAASDPALVGDEPVLMAKRTDCPVVVDPKRSRAARLLVDDGVDVIISDDGLQHYALQRDYEICVIDGERGLGNRQLLPAGPLRETPRRLLSVDQVIVNGNCGGAEATTAEQNALCFELRAVEACRANGSLTRRLENFAGETVHAVAGIGNPGRFFDMLREHGFDVIEHPLRDHQRVDLDRFAGDELIMMTEKDVVKLSGSAPDTVWYVPVTLHMDPAMSKPWLDQLHSRINSGYRPND